MGRGTSPRKRAKFNSTSRAHPALRIYLAQELAPRRLLTEIDRLLEGARGLSRNHAQYADTQDAYKVEANRGMTEAFDFVPGLEKARKYVAWKARGTPTSTGRIEADIAGLRDIDEYLAQVKKEIEVRKGSMALDPFSQPELPDWLETAQLSAESPLTLRTPQVSGRRGRQADGTDDPDRFEFDMG